MIFSVDMTTFEKLGWEPSVCLKDGLRLTYNWIKGEIQKERDNGINNEYARSQVVETSEPKDLGFVYGN
jgi:GDP-D-mannose 3',5'-epimerase